MVHKQFIKRHKQSDKQVKRLKQSYKQLKIHKQSNKQLIRIKLLKIKTVMSIVIHLMKINVGKINIELY